MTLHPEMLRHAAYTFFKKEKKKVCVHTVSNSKFKVLNFFP